VEFGSRTKLADFHIVVVFQFKKLLLLANIKMIDVH